MMVIQKAFTILVVLLAVTLQAVSQERDQWMISKLDDNPVGYYYVGEKSSDDLTMSTLKTKMVLNRMNSKIEFSTESMYTEDEKGLLKVAYKLLMSDQDTKILAEVVEGGLKVTSSVRGTEFEQMVENDKALYGPFLIKQMTLERLKEVGDTLSYFTYLPEFGKIMEVKRVLTAKKSDRLEVKDLIEGIPENIYHLDLSGNMILHASRNPFGMLQTTLSTKEVAQHAANGTVLPDEMFDETMIRNNVRFADARSIDEVVIKISGKDKSLGLPDLEGANQEVLERTDDYVILKITQPKVNPQGISKPMSTPELEEFMQPNTYITSNHPEIQDIANRISTGDVYEDCLNLRDWVSQNMSFDMGVVLAPASEVIKNRKGTCSEYTTLLTSLYRANDLPARVALGFVYMSGVWAGHAWPEVYIDHQWIPFDAAIPGTGVADAARLRFIATSLANGPGDFNEKSGIQMYGNAIIETLSYKVDGKEQLNISKTPYSIVDRQYVNEGLGLQVSIPSSFSFEDEDGVWPESKFLTVVGTSGEKVSFFQKSIYPGQVLAEEMEKAVTDLTRQTATKSNGELQSWTEDGDVFARSIPIGNEYILIQYESANAKKLAHSINMSFTN